MATFEFEKVFDVQNYMLAYSTIFTPETNLKQADFVIHTLNLDNGAKILDLCCGYGRISNRLSEKGFKVTGLGRSEGFLEIARDEAQKQNIDVEYVKGDMRFLPCKNDFML